MARVVITNTSRRPPRTFVACAVKTCSIKQVRTRVNKRGDVGLEVTAREVPDAIRVFPGAESEKLDPEILATPQVGVAFRKGEIRARLILGPGETEAEYSGILGDFVTAGYVRVVRSAPASAAKAERVDRLAAAKKAAKRRVEQRRVENSATPTPPGEKRGEKGAKKNVKKNVKNDANGGRPSSTGGDA